MQLIQSIPNLLYMVLVGLDQILNVFVWDGEFGNIDETLSSRTYRNKDKNSKWSFFHNLVNSCFWFQPEHCLQSFLYEYEKRKQFHERWVNIYSNIPEDKLFIYSKFR